MHHPQTVEFYFDYLSPFAYIAWAKLRRLEDEGRIAIEYHPVLFAALLNHWGQLGPAEIPPKRDYVLKQCFRIAKLAGIPISGVKFHPFNPLVALRVSMKTVAQEHQGEVIDAIWKMGWARGGDPSSENELIAALDNAGLYGRKLVEAAGSLDAKALLRAETERAIRLGIFGVPTMMVDGELFWGNDSIEHMLLFMERKDPLDILQIAEVLQRPRKAERRHP